MRSLKQNEFNHEKYNVPPILLFELNTMFHTVCCNCITFYQTLHFQEIKTMSPAMSLNEIFQLK